MRRRSDARSDVRSPSSQLLAIATGRLGYGKVPKPKVDRRTGGRSVILYELNEVPWEVVDLYVSGRRHSNLAALLHAGLSLTTQNDDPVPLQPWRTWPTFHTSTYTGEHNSIDLGQDPSTFNGDPIWCVAESAGLSVGLFGPLQSWPSRDLAHGGFFVPDTFSRSPETVPAALSRFQQFNITMTRENTFSADSRPGTFQMVTAGFDLVARGLTPRSMRDLTGQLVQELRDARYKGRRPSLQVLPSFDLYWRLHRRYRPHLSIFFTNHVASMMHRYWGDWVPDYAQTERYTPDPVFRQFVPSAMDASDRQLGRIRRYVDSNPGSTLIVASSMGQGGIPYRHLDETFVLESPQRLLGHLRLGAAEAGLAMYPRISLRFDREDEAIASVAPLRSVEGQRCGAMFRNFNVNGRTVSFEINFDQVGAGPDESLIFAPVDGGLRTATPAALGVTLRARTGGGNTAYHIPEGILLAYGAGITPDGTRAKVDVLDVAPSLLANLLDVDPAPSMRGTDRLFR